MYHIDFIYKIYWLPVATKWACTPRRITVESMATGTMKRLKRKIDNIHYINNLWHLSLMLEDFETASFFKKRKVTLHLELINENSHDIRLVFDEESERTEGDVFLIRLDSYTANACHISRDALSSEMIKKLVH